MKLKHADIWKHLVAQSPLSYESRDHPRSRATGPFPGAAETSLGSHRRLYRTFLGPVRVITP